MSAADDTLSALPARPPRGVPQPVLDVCRVTADYYHIPHAAYLIGRDRRQRVALARHVAIYLCRKHLVLSYPALGRAFGGRNHTSCLTAVRKIDRLMLHDRRISADLRAIETELGVAA
jgi:chromosomal replication initiator protein